MKRDDIRLLNPYHKGRALPVGLLRYLIPKQRDLSSIDAQLEHGERELMYHLPLLAGGGPVLNLGDGGSTVILALSLIDHELQGELVSIDSYVDGWRLVHERQRAQFGVTERVRFIHNSTANVYPQLASTYFRLLFIDADHSYEGCKRDAQLYVPQVVVDGLVSFHDVNQEGVDRVIREVMEPDWDLVAWVNRLKVFRRRAKSP